MLFTNYSVLQFPYWFNGENSRTNNTWLLWGLNEVSTKYVDDSHLYRNLSATINSIIHPLWIKFTCTIQEFAILAISLVHFFSLSMYQYICTYIHMCTSTYTHVPHFCCCIHSHLQILLFSSFKVAHYIGIP